jgi:hypothetical protein
LNVDYDFNIFSIQFLKIKIVSVSSIYDYCISYIHTATRKNLPPENFKFLLIPSIIYSRLVAEIVVTWLAPCPMYLPYSPLVEVLGNQGFRGSKEK